MAIDYEGHQSMVWAQLPKAWSQVYAHLNVPVLHNFSCVHLVNAKAHRMMGSWSSVDLTSQAAGGRQKRISEPDNLIHVVGSPNGKHLAVPCHAQWSLVMSF